MLPLSLEEPVDECAAVSLSYVTAIRDLKCPCPEERLIPPPLLITLYPRLKSRGMTERPGLKVQLSQPNRCDRGRLREPLPQQCCNHLYHYTVNTASVTIEMRSVLQVSISLKKVELSVGESKFFTCTVIGEPVSLDWYNPQGERMVPSQRVALHNEGVRSRLTLYNAKIEDAGIYRCQANDAQGHSQEATVVLEIYQKLTFRDVRSPQEFRQGDVAEVVCDVTSSPVPVVSWFYNNEEIIEDTEKFQLLQNNNLQVQRVTKADEGVYRCEARVEARGEIDFRDIILVVNVPPVVSVPQQSFNATADYGESVTFTCRAYGSPEPDVTWHRYDKLITIVTNSESWWMHPELNKMSKLTAILRFSRTVTTAISKNKKRNKAGEQTNKQPSQLPTPRVAHSGAEELRSNRAAS
ncbi:neural cell adhesion molecule 2-like [Garra rufa]|uniref:neural cell adhesion molecule 2-like n=1 Tax=Garra rufa TaxID=137080 RepID=UPI003CCE70D1